MATSTIKKGISWSFITDKNSDIYVCRDGKKMQFKGTTLPRVIDMEIATEEMMSKTTLDIPASDAIAIIFADNKTIVLRVSNFVCCGGFSDDFVNAKTGSAFFKVFIKSTTSSIYTCTETADEDKDTQMEVDEEDSEVIPATQPSQITSQSRGKAKIPPIMSSYTDGTNSKAKDDDKFSSICNKMLAGTYSVKLCHISDAPEHIRFRDVDNVFVQQIKNDMDYAKLTAPQPLALLVISDDFDEQDPCEAQFVCLGGNHLRKAYELSKVQTVESKIYVNLTDEEALYVSKSHNDVGQYIKKMTNFDLILLLRRQLNTDAIERVKDLVLIKSWRNKIAKILPKEKSIKSIQPLLNIAMASKAVYDQVLEIYRLYSAGGLKGQKEKKSNDQVQLNSTSTWKAMMTIEDNLLSKLLDQVINKEMTLEGMQKKCEEIKKYRVLQKKIIKATDKSWVDIVKLYFDGKDEEAEILLHPYLGMSESPEFDSFIRKLQTKEQAGDSKIYAVKDFRAADFVFLGEDEVKEDTIRKIHAKNIANSTEMYTVVSFSPLNAVAAKVADFSYGKIAITEQRKKPDTHFTDLKLLFVAQYGTRVVTTVPGTKATQLFCLKDNLQSIFELFCQESSMVLIMNSKLTQIIQSFHAIKCFTYVYFSNAQEKKNLKRKFHSIGEE